MEKLLHIVKFRKTHVIPIGRRVGLTGIVFCKPNYTADEIELIPTDHFPNYPKRKNLLRIPLKSLSKHITSEFYDRVLECCALYVNDTQARAITDDIIDRIQTYKWDSESKYQLSTMPAIFELFFQIFNAYEVKIPNSKRPEDNWRSILSGGYSLEIEKILANKTEVTRHGQAHTRCLVIPCSIAAHLDWEGKSVGLYSRNGKYIVKLARPQDLAFQKGAGKPTLSEGRVALGRCLYLTKQQRIALGMDGSAYFHAGYMAKMTIDMTGIPVLTYTKATKDDLTNILPFNEALTLIGRKNFYSKKREVIVRIRNNIVLPAVFSRHERLLKEDETVMTAIRNDTLYVFGRHAMCDFTGDRIYQGKQTSYSVPVCESCAPYIESVRDRILNNGSIYDAVVSAKSELFEALDNLERSL